MHMYHMTEAEYVEHLIKNAATGISRARCASYYGCKECQHQNRLDNARAQDEADANRRARNAWPADGPGPKWRGPG